MNFQLDPDYFKPVRREARSIVHVNIHKIITHKHSGYYETVKEYKNKGYSLRASISTALWLAKGNWVTA